MDSEWKAILRFLGISFYALYYTGCFIIIKASQSTYNIVNITIIVLPILIVLIMNYLRKKRQKTTTFKYMKAVLLYSIAPIICLYLLTVNEYKSIFTTEKWLEQETERTFMIDNLLKEHPLKGKQKKDIISLLGQETAEANFKEKDNMVYLLGAERGFISMDTEWLIIHFNDENIADKVEVVSS
ncbi:hypothetical protein [Niallia taxi]|uniref:hypothetical protein n=1 Tax=Niallia taxi TaxID=2499688 RepID=UPI0011A62957|nr:hypothetical protein [Niallia taxi]MCT2344763.1 hypothetical protein [Niallia taxi]MED3963288.1 hypothetical protein [Niallia taxi]